VPKGINLLGFRSQRAAASLKPQLRGRLLQSLLGFRSQRAAASLKHVSVIRQILQAELVSAAKELRPH